MITNILDSDLHKDPRWKTHIPSDGSQIGGVDPSAYGLLQDLPGEADRLLFFVKGALAYSTVEGYLVRPFFPLAYLTFSYSLIVDDRTATNGQVIETDIITVDDQQLKYDFSLQLDIAAGWMLEVHNPWKATGVKIAPLAPNVEHRVVIIHRLDVVKKTAAVMSYGVDGVVYQLPDNTIAAVPTTWDKNRTVIQAQQCTAGPDMAYSIEFPKMDLLWSGAF